MEIVKAEKVNLLDVVFLFREVVKDMNKKGLYHWNTDYPNPEIISQDIDDESLYMVMSNYACIGVLVMNGKSSPEYNTIDWKSNGEKVLYIHRMAVHPLFAGKGITEKMLGFAEKYGKENEYTAIRVDVFDSNEKRIDLIKNRKFDEAGKLHFEYQKTPFSCFEKGI